MDDANMLVDARKRLWARERYLLVLLEKTEADGKAGLEAIGCLEEMEIARLSGLDNATVDRISQELVGRHTHSMRSRC
jgi:hypothetical protein